MFLSSLYQQSIIKNYQNFLAKDLKYQFVGMNIKPKKEKDMANQYRYFLGSKLVGNNRFFDLVYSNAVNDAN